MMAIAVIAAAVLIFAVAKAAQYAIAMYGLVRLIAGKGKKTAEQEAK